jgi:hypothetical protein
MTMNEEDHDDKRGSQEYRTYVASAHVFDLKDFISVVVMLGMLVLIGAIMKFAGVI